MKNSRKKKIVLVYIVIMLILALSCVFYKFLNPLVVKGLYNNFNVIRNKNNLLVHYISVGQGDAIAINLPNGKTLLIDTGPKYSAVDYTNYIAEKVVNNKTNKFIDYLVLSHSDMDHCGGTMRLFNEFEIGMVFLPIVEADSAGYKEILNYVHQNCNYKTISNEFNLSDDEFNLACFGPLDFDDRNDACAVLKLEYQNKKFLFTGDISIEAEAQYINLFGEDLNIDVLKVAHHGSRTSSSEEFLQATTPDYAIISVGENSYGHPTDEALTRLETAEAKVMRTDKLGNIVFVVDDCYGFDFKTGDYYVTGLSLDYRIIVLVVDGVLLCCCVIVVLKKEKQNKKRKAKNK